MNVADFRVLQRYLSEALQLLFQPPYLLQEVCTGACKYQYGDEAEKSVLHVFFCVVNVKKK